MNQHFLEKHPTPWNLEYSDGKNQRARVVDAKGVPVITAWDADSVDTEMRGDVFELLKFINEREFTLQPADKIIREQRDQGKNPLHELYHQGYITVDDLKGAPAIYALVTARVDQLLGEMQRRADERGLE